MKLTERGTEVGTIELPVVKAEDGTALLEVVAGELDVTPAEDFPTGL